MIQLLTLTISDSKSVVRRTVLKALTEPLDNHLASVSDEREMENEEGMEKEEEGEEGGRRQVE